MKKITNKKEKIKAIQELLRHTDISAWDGVEKYRREHNGELPPEKNNMRSDLLPFNHGEEDTHFACVEQSKLMGVEVSCCGCTGHKCQEQKSVGNETDFTTKEKWEELGINWERICSNESTLQEWIKQNFISKKELLEKSKLIKKEVRNISITNKKTYKSLTDIAFNEGIDKVLEELGVKE